MAAIVTAKITTIAKNNEYVTFTATSNTQKELKTITVLKKELSSIFDMDQSSGVYLYKGTLTVIKTGDTVDLYVVSLSGVTVTQALLKEAERDPGSPSLLKRVDFDSNLQLGNSVFYVPPTQIKVDKISTTRRTPTIRSKGSIKTQSGHTDTRVTLTLFFPTLESINDENNGLMAIIAQFMRTPFVPVVNKFLNNIHYIDAVCLQDLSVTTVPNFPKSLQAEITLLAFEYMVFMPQEPNFLKTIDADLFRWYYKKDLVNGEKRKLKPVSRTDSGVTFTYLPEDFVAALKEKRQNSISSGLTPGESAVENYYNANQDLNTFNKACQALELAASGRNYQQGEYYDCHIPHPSEISMTYREGYAWAWIRFLNPKNHGLTDDPGFLPDHRTSDGWTYLVYDTTKGGFSKTKERISSLLKDTLSRERASLDKAQFNADIYSSERVRDMMQDWPMDYNNIIVTDVNISYQNTFARLPLLQFERPGFQFLGTQDVYAKISMEVLGDEALASIQRLYEYTQRIAREYRFDMVASHVGIRNEILQMFGIDFVMIDTLTCSTIPNFPGRYFVEITMMDFDVCQRKRELGEVIGTSGNDVVFKDPDNLKNPVNFRPGYVIFNSNTNSPIVGDKAEGANRYWMKLESIFRRINLYPDLDLPTWKEVETYLNSVGRKLWKDETGKRGVFADPDFYFRPLTDLKTITKDVLSRNPELTVYETNFDGKIKTSTVEGGVSLSSKRPASQKQAVLDTQKAKLQNDEAKLTTKQDEQEKNWLQKAWDAVVKWNDKMEKDDSTGVRVENFHKGGIKGLFEVEMEEMTLESRPEYKDRAFPVGVGPEGKYAISQWKDQWTDQREYDKTGTMARAFPTAHVFLVDEGERIGWYKLWDNFYGMNAISSIEISRSRKIATDTVYMNVSNVYRRYVDRKFKVKDVDFNLNRFFQLQIDDEMKRRHGIIKEHMGLYPGARMHIRMGYGNNLAELPILFNGTLTEVGVGDMIQVVAQSDALELTSILNYTKDKVAGNLEQGEEPSNMLVRLLVRGDKQGLSRMWSAIKSNWMQDDSNGIIHYGTPNFFLGTYVNAGELGQNIYPGNGTGKTDFGIIMNNEPNIHLMMSGKTTYDIVQLLSMYIPNYIACVHPFEFRSTLFYGKPYWDLTYGYEISDTNKEGFVPAYVYDPVTQLGIDLGYFIRAKKKPYQQWHIYSSFGHIIDNRIKATAEGMYQNCIVTIKEDKFWNLGHDQKESNVLAKADADIYSHIQRTTSVSSELYVKKPFAILGPITGLWNVCSKWLGTMECAQNLGMAVVRDYLKDMYQGDLVCMGDPTLKPYDGMYISDSYNEMFGACFVKQVVHQFSLDTGFISLVSPDAAVGIIEDDFTDTVLWASAVAVGSQINWGLACEAANGLRAQGILKAAGFARKAANLAFKWGSSAIGENLAAGSAELEATAAAVGAATPPGWVLLLATTALVLGTKIFENMIQNKLRESQCVVCNFLTLHGEEYSAGVTGHIGITVGSMGGKQKTGYWDRVTMGLPPWVKNMFKLDEVDLNPKMLYGGSEDMITAMDTMDEESFGYNGKINPNHLWIWPSTGTITNVFGRRKAPITTREIPIPKKDAKGNVMKDRQGKIIYERDSTGKIKTQKVYEKGSETHGGIDIAAALNTPIKSTADGNIYRINADPSSASGKFIIIRHASNAYSVYCHLNEIGTGIYEGRDVKQGDIIGYMGSTGRSSGSHLHFGIKKSADGDDFVDPFPYLSTDAPPIKGSEVWKDILGNYHNKT